MRRKTLSELSCIKNSFSLLQEEEMRDTRSDSESDVTESEKEEEGGGGEDEDGGRGGGGEGGGGEEERAGAGILAQRTLEGRNHGVGGESEEREESKIKEGKEYLNLNNRDERGEKDMEESVEKRDNLETSIKLKETKSEGGTDMNEALDSSIEHNAKAQVVKEAKTEK